MAVLRDPDYLDWIKEHARCVCSELKASEYNIVEPAHTGTLGRGIKSPDNEVLPMLHYWHHKCHTEGELTTLRYALSDEAFRKALRALGREIHQEYLEEMKDD